MDREFPFPLPFSWYQVAYSDEIGVGELKPIHYFGRELVLFRDMAGTARVFDAFCPHLGAHIGYGGEVTEQGLRCPFHHWSFSPEDGHCVDIPYCKRIPPKAAVEPLPVCEKNGIIMAWYHPLGESPKWEIPDLPEYDDPAWTEWTRRDWTVKSRTQELAENTVDAAHFLYVHGTKNIATTVMNASTTASDTAVDSSSSVMASGARGLAVGLADHNVDRTNDGSSIAKH